MELTRDETNGLIWTQLQNSKYKEFQLDILLERFQKRDRLSNIFLVIVTSSSVSAWAIWHDKQFLQWIWAVIIAISQLISLIKPYLNYSKYTKELNEKHFLLQTLNVEYEKLWLAFKFERIDIQQAFEKTFELKNTMSKSLNFSEDIILNENVKIEKLAKDKLLNYLISTFNYDQNH